MANVLEFSSVHTCQIENLALLLWQPDRILYPLVKDGCKPRHFRFQISNRPFPLFSPVLARFVFQTRIQ